MPEVLGVQLPAGCRRQAARGWRLRLPPFIGRLVGPVGMDMSERRLAGQSQLERVDRAATAQRSGRRPTLRQGRGRTADAGRDRLLVISSSSTPPVYTAPDTTLADD
eukprot:scaffold76390_cov35-Prasinocladus_malaysianus.AAC.1